MMDRTGSSGEAAVIVAAMAKIHRCSLGLPSAWGLIILENFTVWRGNTDVIKFTQGGETTQHGVSPAC